MQVIRRANANPYGLASGVFARDVDVLNTLARSLKCGTVWQNCFNVCECPPRPLLIWDAMALLSTAHHLSCCVRGA